MKYNVSNDEIVVRMTLAEARNVAIAMEAAGLDCGEDFAFWLTQFSTGDEAGGWHLDK